MSERKRMWTKKQLREQLQVIRGEKAPSKVLIDATYLNVVHKKWMKGHIWIYDNRIIYVGNEQPELTDGTELIDCSNRYVVPGYIEPHVHPFQIYNPQSFAQYASVRGTTTLICDNMKFLLKISRGKAFTLMEDLNELPVSFYWWGRYDAQTELNESGENETFSYENIHAWMQHPHVVQGGELTSWPKVLAGDDEVLEWMQMTKELGKPIEGHLPGASEKTLTQMALLGVNSDHEAMTGEEAVQRLDLGYTTSLRYSSIRPDLPKMLQEMVDLGVDSFESIHMTTDGSPPAFYEQGVMERLIEIALDTGIADVDAYAIASYHPARHYHLDDVIGMIAPGRLAHLNILEDKNNPTPVSVLAKGEWLRYENDVHFPENNFSWKKYSGTEVTFDWDLKEDDLQFSMPFGINMVNSVITKPYQLQFDTSEDQLSQDHDECFFMLVDRCGKWRVNTLLKGFANKISGFVSSFSSSGDIVVIGKNLTDMLTAFRRMKELGGGIVLVEDGEVISEISLPLFGEMSSKPLEELIVEEKQLTEKLRERGYRFEDPLYSLLFFSSTHLPYIRITQKGLYDVKNRTVLYPAMMRS